MDDRRYSQIAFDAYGEAGRTPGPWLTFDGRPMPRWADLTTPQGEETRRRWEEASFAAIDAYLARNGLPPRMSGFDVATEPGPGTISITADVPTKPDRPVTNN